MAGNHQDLSFSTSSSSTDIPLNNADFESSLDSYSNLFDKAKHNFSASSEISFIRNDIEQLNENPFPSTVHNQTFTKDVSRTIINIFTGKPISPNPWRKLCTKTTQHQTQTDITIPVEVLPSNFQPKQSKQILQGQFNNKMITRQARSGMIINQRAMDKTNDDQAFEECNFTVTQEHPNPVVVEIQKNTPLQHRRKKRTSLKDCTDKLSSDEDIKEHPSCLTPKTNRLINNHPTWQRLADVYTSDSSDETNSLLLSNPNLTVRLKSEIYTFDQSTGSSNSTSSSSATAYRITFLESLSENISIEDKHPDAKPYFISSGFEPKSKRQELADKLLLIFNQDVFSSQLSDKVSVVWSGRLTVTAGHCTTRRNTCTAVITLSHKVCDSPERCRDTLLHEMCHAAVTLIDGIMEHGHGILWNEWIRKAEQCYPYLPPISVRHTYDVRYKFIYRCVQCQHEVYRHSKSLDLNNDVCAKCFGSFQLVINSDKDQTPRKTINQYKKKTNFDMPDLDKLKI